MYIRDTIQLFPVLNEKLETLLRSLSTHDWQRQTIARKWKVKDVASHLLDGNLRRIAIHRDGWLLPPDREIHSYAALVNYLNNLNGDWVNATKRLSPQIITGMLEQTNYEVYEILRKLDPAARAVFSVGWAGEDVSTNQFDIAREYTERWLHQQQIRAAVSDNSLLTKELYFPFLDVFMQAWSHTCKHMDAPEGTILKATITGEGGGEWFLIRDSNTWKLTTPKSNIIGEAIIDGDFAWKLFSKSLRKDDVSGCIELKGEKQFAAKVLDMVSVMA